MVIYNEDPNHFVHSRYLAGVRELTKPMLEEYIAGFQHTSVTDFAMCVNASIPFFDTVNCKHVMQQYREFEKDGKLIGREDHVDFGNIRLLTEFYEVYQMVPQDIWIPALRKIGIHPWISIRMNDIHDTDREDSILFSKFFKANRMKNRASHRGAKTYYEYGLDYSYPEVRQYYLNLIEEAVNRFDADTVELDFMREIYSVGIGREYEGATILNAFMADAKAIIQKAESKWHHAIGIAVRVPDSLEKALRLGFDVLHWVQHGLVNHITVTSRWSSIDNDMPIDLWKEILKPYPVTVAAGMEILLDAYNRRGRRYDYNTEETAIGTACAYHFEKADGIYLFNYMDMPIPQEGKDCDLLHDKETYRRFLTDVGDYEKLQQRSRRHVVTYDDVSAVSVSGKKQLPMILRGNDGAIPYFDAARVVTGEIPKDKNVTVLLGVESENFSPESLTVYASRRKCDYIGERESRGARYRDIRYYAYSLVNDGKLPPVFTVELGLSSGKATVHWLEIQIS